jgi:hypothetical protein
MGSYGTKEQMFLSRRRKIEVTARQGTTEYRTRNFERRRRKTGLRHVKVLACSTFDIRQLFLAVADNIV